MSDMATLPITCDQAERIGEISDTADNFSAAANIPMPANIHIRCLTEGMQKIRDELRALYREVTNSDPWE